MIVPLMFGLAILQHSGRAGLAIAAGMFLIVGWWICLMSDSWGRRLLFGTLLLAFTQFMPVLQIFAGMFAVNVVDALGMAIQGNDEQIPGVVSELGGFLVTLLTGTPLAIVAILIGSVYCYIFPGNKRSRPAMDNEAEDAFLRPFTIDRNNDRGSVQSQ